MKYLNLKSTLLACACAIATTEVAAEPMGIEAYKAFADYALSLNSRPAPLTTEQCHYRVDYAVQFGLITSEAGDWSKANDIVPSINIFDNAITTMWLCGNL